MADVGQLLLQNELFVVLGATLFAALPVISPYWLPVIYPNSAPKQFQLSSDAAIATTVTRTATIFPKPTTLTDKVYQTIVQTQTATRIAITTATVPKTIYDTVTEQVTSVSTYYDRHWLTKWTHFSVDPATPCTTVVYTPHVTIQSRGIPASKAYPLNIATLPTITPETASWIPWRFIAYTLFFLLAASSLAHLIMWFWDPRVIRLSGDVQALQETLAIRTKSRQDVTGKYETDQAALVKRCEKAERVAVMVQARDIMLRKLGVSMLSDEADNKDIDKETLANMVQARMKVLVDEKQRLDRLETESKDQMAEIKELKNTITNKLEKVYVPGVSRSFDELLYDKQREINILRNEVRRSDLDENIKENHRLHQEKDAKLKELQPLRDEVVTLREALTEAREETARVEEERKAKGVADQRRWNDARVNLRKERSDEISALKEKHANRAAALEFRLKQRAEEVKTQTNKIADLNAQLRKAKRSLASSSKTQQAQSSNRPDIETPTQRFNDTSSEQNTSTENEDYLRQSLDKRDQEYRELQQNFMILAKQYREKVEELERLKDQNADDRKHCENEKNKLREQITELERTLEEAAQRHGSQSFAVIGPTTNKLQSGSITSDSCSKANETSHEQLKEQIYDLKTTHETMVFVEMDLRAQIASLSKDIQVKEAKEDELSIQISTSRKQLEAKLTQEQALSNQIATLTQQRDTAIEETTDVKKQLEDAKSKSKTVWSELQELKAATNNNEMAAATLERYQVELTQRDQNMEKLRKSNTDLQAQYDQLRKECIQDINGRNHEILQLRTDAIAGNETIRDLEQQLSALKTNNGNQNRVIRDQQATINATLSTTEALKNELQAEKDRYLIDVNSLKNDVDYAEREAEKEKEGRKNDVRLSREREAKAVDEARRERQQEIDDLKNSQEASTIKKLQERVEFYEMENTDLKENEKQGWKNLLMRKNEELRQKEAKLSYANDQIRHWYRLYNIFHRRFEGLERNQAYKEGKVDYAEARAGLFMGKDTHISAAMEKCVKFTEYLEAEVGRLKKEVDRLRKYDQKAVEDEMDVDEKME